jgi:diacylglycerol kinase
MLAQARRRRNAHEMTKLKERPLLHRLTNGVAGLGHGWRRERSLRTQLLVCAAVIMVMALVRPPLLWVAAVVVMLALAVAAELINAALEALLDRLHPDYDPDIGAAKDMGSAAVLVVNIAAGVAFAAALLAARD